MKKLLSLIYRKTRNMLVLQFLKARHRNVVWGNQIKIASRIYFSANKTAKVIIGNGVKINNRTKQNYVGLYKRSSFHIGKNATLMVGDYSGFSGVSLFCSKEITIGK